MAFDATTQLYRREAALNNARADQLFNTYLADLARSYGIAEGSLNANLEGRGIFRSGEASTARTRLAAENQALQSKAMQDRDYQKNMTDINLLKQLAALQASSTQQGSTPQAQFTPAPPPPPPPPRANSYATPQQRVAVTPSGMGSGRTPTGTEERRVAYFGRR